MSPALTPTLVVGDSYIGENGYRVDTVSEAVQLVRAGLVAMLPDGAWTMAEEVLRAVTDDHDAILRAMLFGRVGRLDIEPCACPSCLAGVTRRRQPKHR